MDEKGENCIAVAPGTNNDVTPERIRECEDVIARSGMVTLQMEIPPESNSEILELAEKHDVPVLLNYAPFRGGAVSIKQGVTWLVVNEVEVGALAECVVNDQDSAIKASRKLIEQGPEWVVVTLGKAGVVAVSADEVHRADIYPLEVVDTTAAGDTFCGVFAAGLAEGMSEKDAMHFANAAANLTVTKLGAQPSIPNRGEITRLLESI